MRTYLIAGNWKMHTTPAEAATLAASIAEQCATIQPPPSVHVLMCPPFTSIHAVSEAVQQAKGTALSIGAQHCHFEPKGAFTGEIAPAMLKAVGCSHVIIGHSERRQYFNETDDMLNKKISAVLHNGLVPVFCVGETLQERQGGRTLDVVRTQLVEGLKGITLNNAAALVIAYEPVWAIGTGLAATSEQAQEVHAFIRGVLKELYPALASEMLILYGGSLKPENADELLGKPDVNGGLIGGASLTADAFCAIIASARALARA
jgi:triosephosphate isomerase (TIM)